MSRKYYEENFKKQLVNIYNQGNHTYRDLHQQYGSLGYISPIEYRNRASLEIASASESLAILAEELQTLISKIKM